MQAVFEPNCSISHMVSVRLSFTAAKPRDCKAYIGILLVYFYPYAVALYKLPIAIA